MRKPVYRISAGAYTASPTAQNDVALDAQVAQLVEHATENRSVTGSIPVLGTTTPDFKNGNLEYNAT